MKRLLLAQVLLFLPLFFSLAKADDLIDNPNYKARCKVCHGANAEGKAEKKIPALKTRADRSEAELTKAIEDGNPTTTPKMPPFKEKLTAEDIKALVQQIKALK